MIIDQTTAGEIMKALTKLSEEIMTELYSNSEVFFNDAVIWEHCNGYGATLENDYGEKFQIFAPTVEKMIVKIYEEN